MKINATQPDIEFIDYSAPRLPDTNWRIRINVSGSLAHVQAFIDGNCHLPEVPCEAQRRAGGMDMAEMQMDRLKKIEAPTLYTLEQEDRIPRLEAAL
ncbi:hypothetical protein ACFQFQ_04525 [Sulfitobacter porphyrae]|uniref:Uncharacterized protein n=1 Tax=Sulfitobacter porphyrae TaxID=1246864 RepID=A0ABW2B084_9RHOB